MAEDGEAAGVGLTVRTAKGIDGRAHLPILETPVQYHLLPTCTRQATSDSTSPKINIGAGLIGHRLAIGDVGELQNAARPQDAPNLVKDLAFIGT
jgi:hypothetical protein